LIARKERKQLLSRESEDGLMIKIKKILLPTDFSVHSDHALVYAVEFACNFDADICVLHVLRGPIYPVAYAIDVDFDALDTEMRISAETQLESTERKITLGGVHVESSLITGIPSPRSSPSRGKGNPTLSSWGPTDTER